MAHRANSDPLPPATAAGIEATARHCRQLVKRRACLAAGVAALPVPGLDWATDVGILLKLIPDINRAFGLSPQQVEKLSPDRRVMLSPDRRVMVYKALSTGGSLLIGKVITRPLVWRVLQAVGVRLSAQQVAKYVPLIGQAVSAALTFSALRYVCEKHIQQCIAVAGQLLLLPGAGTMER
jgi:uncharacterized protein (DUF697 family)